MKLVSRQIHIVRFDGCLQEVKQAFNSRCTLSRNGSLVAVGKKAFGPFVFEGFDHGVLRAALHEV